MKIVYGTHNPGKMRSMREMLSGLPITLSSLANLEGSIPDAPETGRIPLHNAREKALFYYHHIKRPVFSCDSGLFVRELPESKQPGTHIRRINGRRLDDEETITYYSDLVGQHGGRLTAYYKNAICLVIDENTVISCDKADLDDAPFWIVGQPHRKRESGFPLDCLSVDMSTGCYYYDLPPQQWNNSKQPRPGFRRFFGELIRDYAHLFV